MCVYVCMYVRVRIYIYIYIYNPSFRGPQFGSHCSTQHLFKHLLTTQNKLLDTEQYSVVLFRVITAVYFGNNI